MSDERTEVKGKTVRTVPARFRYKARRVRFQRVYVPLLFSTGNDSFPDTAKEVRKRGPKREDGGTVRKRERERWRERWFVG